MCVMAFVVEDSQVIKIQTFPTIPKAPSCENILLYETYQLMILRKNVMSLFVTLFSFCTSVSSETERSPRGD